MRNLYSDLPVGQDLDAELVDVLAESSEVRVERIVSTGQASPDAFWYDSKQAEWVVVLKGEAKLRFADDQQTLHMKPGDHVTIPAHRKHRVEWTTSEGPTVWLAIFYNDRAA